MAERRTPLYDFHLRSAREVIKGGGDYMFPSAYTSPVEEHLNVRRNVGMQDLSTMGEIDIKGPGAERLVRRLLVNEVLDLEPSQLRYSTMCNEEGGIVDDVTVYKFDDEHFMIVASSGPRLKSLPMDLRARRRPERLRHRRDGCDSPAGRAGSPLAQVPQDGRQRRGSGRAALFPLRAGPHKRY